METYQTKKGIEQLRDINRLVLLQQNMLENEQKSDAASEEAIWRYNMGLMSARAGDGTKAEAWTRTALIMEQRARNTNMLFNIVNRERGQTPAVSYPAKLEDIGSLISVYGLPSRIERYLAAYEVDILEQGFLEKGLTDSLRKEAYEVAFVLRPEAVSEYLSLDKEFLGSFAFDGLKQDLQGKIRRKVALLSAQKNKKLLMRKGIGFNIRKEDVLGIIAREDVLETKAFEGLVHDGIFGNMPVVTNTGKMVFLTPNGNIRY